MVDYLKTEIREGVDIAARMNQQAILIALPGATLTRVETIAAQFKDYIGSQIKAPRDLSIDVAVGVATYTGDDSAGLPIAQEVDALIDKACGQVHPA